MKLPTDILDRLTHDYGEEAAEKLSKKLCDVSSSDRVHRCIVFAAGGDRLRFEELCELAALDYRDVIVAAEYNTALVRLYDFNRTFDNAELDPP
ncbi:MAG: hypothetical protein AAF790_11770 [Planctomycetota bacterium]